MEGTFASAADFVCSSPEERCEGARILQALEQSSMNGDPLAEALMRAHALMLGYPAIKALSRLIKGDLAGPTLRLNSTMKRHESAYFLVIPNIWIDLDPIWLLRLKKLLDIKAFARFTLEQWGILVPPHVRDHALWFVRCFEAALLESAPVSPLLIGIANFRKDAALPGEFIITGEFCVSRRRTIHKSDGNALRRQLRMARHHRVGAPFVCPRDIELAQLDSPMERLVSLSLYLRLHESGVSHHDPLTAERFSCEQERILRVLKNGGTVENKKITKAAWNDMVKKWDLLKHHFDISEQEAIERLFGQDPTKIFTPDRYDKCGAFNLVPPTIPSVPYSIQPELEYCTIRDAVKWAYLLLLRRNGLRASDLYSLNSANISGIGTPDLTLTVPFTKTTGRRSYVVGLTLTPGEHLELALVVNRMSSEGLLSTSWFSIITGDNLPGRWQYDFAYQAFRRSISPSGMPYLRTHIPRHIFATSFGIWYSGLVLGNWGYPFFRLWTSDPEVLSLNESSIPSINARFPNALSLVNQIMGHATPAQFIETYCHSWPLILAATAEARRAGKIPWGSIEKSLLSSSPLSEDTTR